MNEEFVPARVTLGMGQLHIIAFDPGESTGIAYLPEQVTKTLTYVEMKDWFLHYCKPLPNTTLVVEKFVNRPSAFAKDQVAGRLCGMLELFAEQNNCKLVWQTPQVMKTMIPDGKTLRELGWQWKGPHELDALRHAIYYLLTGASQCSKKP